MSKKLSIIGGGSWGTALAKAATDAGTQVMLFARDNEVVNDINKNHKNTKYNIEGPLNFKATNDLKTLLEFSDNLLVSTPLKTEREILNQVKDLGFNPKRIINVSKGFEPVTGMLPSQIINDVFPKSVALTLTGPSHAESLVIKGITAVMVLSDDIDQADEVADMFRSSYFRLYTGTDLKGAEVYGAAKNIYAIGAGILDALGETDNTKAAFITRSLHELNKLGLELGAQIETIFSLAGVGDLIVTAFSANSRNYSYGHSLITGKNKPKTTVEGVNTLKTILKVAADHKVEMPIASVIDMILDGKVSAREGIDMLVGRKQ